MAETVAGRSIGGAPRAAWRALRAEVAGQPRALKLWFALLTVLMAVGAVGAVLTLPPGDEVFGTNPSFEWGLLIAAYVFFAITTSGLCLASSLGTVFGLERFMPLEKRHAVLALLSLVTAFGVIALDLHYPIRLGFGAVLSPSPTSPMWWMGVLYGGYLALLVVEVWSMFTGHERTHNIACTSASCMAILAPSTLGAVFGVLAARPYWHGSFTPPSLLAAALLSGISLLGIVFYLVHRFQLKGWERATSLAIPALRLLLTISLAVTILVAAWQILTTLYGSVPGLGDAMSTMLVGPLAPWFWIGRVGVGVAIPMVLVLYRPTQTPVGLFAASILAFVGVLVDRVLFVSAGQIVSSTPSSGVVSSPFNEYTPSFVEISILVGSFAFLAFGYTLAERFLDMSEHVGSHRPLLSGWGRHPHEKQDAGAPLVHDHAALAHAEAPLVHDHAAAGH
jgi:molybdopterin-containing oxidoreductase family membrane subunit